VDSYFAGTYDVIVVGAGHAGCEAALAAAKKGLRTLICTLHMDSVAFMPCNPSIGGTGKGQLVREVDALGGQMAKSIDEVYLQSKMLNTSKGPAVHSLRAQADKKAYSAAMKHLLEKTPGLELKEHEVTALFVADGKVGGVYTKTGGFYEARAVVVATGTYLQSRVVIGEAAYASGPAGLPGAAFLSSSLSGLGFSLQRLKTGTPARANRRSVDFSVLTPQYGDSAPEPFSYSTKAMALRNEPCFLAYTNEATHEAIRKNLHRSPLFSGFIEGVGPRYCPSIEDKVVRFPDRSRHQFFVEPEGLSTEEVYLQGLSSSLPVDVQESFLRTIVGFEHIEVMKPAYAIEYDAIDPTQLAATLESKAVSGLFFAGQINGTSGYEEAAAQGIVGINAAEYCLGNEMLTLSRHESYIGTLIDDIVTKGAKEPYRIMTSRVELRLLIRQDNADLRLTAHAHRHGMVDDARFTAVEEKARMIEAEKERLRSVHASPGEESDRVLERAATSPIKAAQSLYSLLKRPGVSYEGLSDLDPNRPALDAQVAKEAEIEAKYEDYIAKQLHQKSQAEAAESRTIPAGFEYGEVHNLRNEAREKLSKIRPASLGQASRISGVSPADIQMLYIALKKNEEERSHQR